MQDTPKPYCPECDDLGGQPDSLDRRDFMRAAAVLALGSVAAVPRVATAADKAPPAARAAKPAEALIQELHASLSAEQKKQVILPWDYKIKGQGGPARLGMYNSAIEGRKIGTVYTKPQQELIDRILHSISADEDGYRQISRGGTWDNSGSLENCGALLFGEPGGGQKYSWVFTGHHLTVRCDGNSEEGAAFGGPMYYGHSPNGYSEKNIFNYQTKSVLRLYEALSEQQQKKAVVAGTSGEGAGSVVFRKAHPGVSFAELSADQKKLVEQVMRTVLAPYRKEDADEVMTILKTNGGIDKLHLAFYQDGRMNDAERWHFWRLEGPGFVWNYRVLPHVHTYVNISSKV